MRKQLLVTVDRGETRVAILESEGSPSGASGSRQEEERRLARRGALHRAPRLALDRREHLQGQGRQRPARPRGGLRGHRPREERLPARRRRGLPRRRGGPPRSRRPWQQGEAHHRAAQARPGDPRPGDQGPAQDQGPAPVDAALDRRPLPRVRAAGRGRRRIAPARRQGARPGAPRGRQGRPRRRRRDRAHRRAGRDARGLRARDQVPAQAARRAPEARGGDGRAGRWSSRRPTCRCAWRATSSRASSRRRSWTTASSTTGSSPSSTGPRRSCSSGSSSTRTTSRCSSATTWRRRSSRCCGAGWTCPAAAT